LGSIYWQLQEIYSAASVILSPHKNYSNQFDRVLPKKSCTVCGAGKTILLLFVWLNGHKSNFQVKLPQNLSKFLG